MLELSYFRGRVAQNAILRALGIGPGHEVAVQAFTCSAVAEGVLSLGAQPVYVDVSAGRFTMDPDDLATKLTPRTRAIIVQHTFGIPADLPRIMPVAAARELPVIEDCAHAIGSTIDGRRVGEVGVAAFYSYEASKPIFVGIGGSARVNDASLLETMRRHYSDFPNPGIGTQSQIFAMYLAHRVAYHPATYWTVRAIFRRMVRLGVIRGNHRNPADEDFSVSVEQERLGPIQRGILRREVGRLERNLEHRRSVAAGYRASIQSPAVHHPELSAGTEVVFGRYPLLSDQKEAVLRRAAKWRVELADWYATPVHPLVGGSLAAAGYLSGSCPNAEQLTTQVISLPTGSKVGEAQIARAAQLFASS